MGYYPNRSFWNYNFWFATAVVDEGIAEKFGPPTGTMAYESLAKSRCDLTLFGFWAHGSVPKQQKN
jgi:hypothetical protein